MQGLGEKIRGLRKRKQLTIIEMAKTTGIDQATLSRIENGKMTGTLDSHRRIAEALGLRLPELYDSVMQELAKAKDSQIQRKVDAFHHSGGAVAELLTTSILQKKMMPVLIRLKPRGRTEIEELGSFAERFIYILKGAIELNLSGTPLPLKQGQSHYFQASAAHFLVNKDKKESVVLSVITPTSL